MNKNERNQYTYRNTPDISNKFKFSIVYKLNLRLMLRMLWLFLYLDIIICAFASVSTLTYAEHIASNAAQMVIGAGMPDKKTDIWLESSGLDIKKLALEPDGFRIPRYFHRFFPEDTASGVRSFELKSPDNKSILKRLESLRYNITFEDKGINYRISVSLAHFLRIFEIAFLALLGIEFLVLISRTSKDARLIRTTLDPITEFTKVAQSLNTASSQFDPDKMAALAGKLEGINAARLDTRIQIDETQDELKNLARAINGMLDRINESYRAQVRFVSDASHELRTPISVIQGYANLLDRWGKNDEKTLQESITAIKDEAANMKELIEQLLFLARGDNNTMTLQVEEFSLPELASEVLGETKLIDSTHQFQSDFKDAIVSADRALIKQALRILVDNAIKYTDSGGCITIRTSMEGGLARLSVQDDGIGIRPEIVPYIFDRFYRADESRARATGGAGLGLSIAKWITSRHGGHMEVLSREGLGTRISIVLPVSKAETALPRESGPELI